MLNSIIKFYGRLHSSKLPSFFFTPLRRFVRYIANMVFPILLQHKSMRRPPLLQTSVIVSLTSFPLRIGDVWQVIELMKRQTYKPRKVILWLSKEQFPDVGKLPLSLLRQQDDVFSIRFMDGDIRSHKKYYYVSQEYPDSDILLVDDDIYYPTDMLERLYKAKQQSESDRLICQYGYIIGYDDKGQILPYRQWKSVTADSDDEKLFFGSGGGTLFKPKKMYKDLLDKNLFLQLTPIADDIWLNTMAKLAEYPIIMLKPNLPLPIKSKKGNISLYKENVGNNKNDDQIKKIIDFYLKDLGVDPFHL